MTPLKRMECVQPRENRIDKWEFVNAHSSDIIDHYIISYSNAQI